MGSELVGIVSQFGAAGLIGWLWIAERRHNAKRERELTEAHQLMVEQNRDIESLLGVIKENTRAIKGLEETQHHLLEMVKGLGHETRRPNKRQNHSSLPSRNHRMR